MMGVLALIFPVLNYNVTIMVVGVHSFPVVVVVVKNK